jgi:tRNA modification GTPase
MEDNATIAAIATAPGQGAIAVIRVSGPDAFSIVDKLFLPTGKGANLSDRLRNTLVHGILQYEQEIIDDVLVSLFRAPHSYTGEDVIEISCHGSVVVQKKILHILILSGARLSKPGEFTMRAFLNGKLDLSQAEAVADLISSNSEASRKVALRQMRGGFSGQIQELRDRLLNFISLIELELDFSEEDVEFADRTQLKALVQEIHDTLSKITRSFDLGNVIKNGIPVAIIGEPNVGKSTLLNVLLNEEKAIVSDIPGTTRDAIEDTIHVGDLLFRFIDTAGIRETTDTIETIGIEKTFEKVKQATVILFMVDAESPTGVVGEKLNKLLKLIQDDSKAVIVVVNKIDKLKKPFDSDQFVRMISKGKKTNFAVAGISAKMKLNIEQLTGLLVELTGINQVENEDIIITNARHFEALEKSRQAAQRVLNGLSAGIPGDLLAMDIREILHYFGEITGQITTDEILGNIFKNFCIGK